MRQVRPAAIACLVLLTACARSGGGNAAAPANVAAVPTNSPPVNAIAAADYAAQFPKLVKIFTPDILGANVAYLETLTGPAFRTEGADRIYKVEDCEIIVGAAKGKIANIGIDGVSPRCSFPIAQYFAEGYDHPVPPLPTFGDIKEGLGGHYGATCLTLCGNAAAPVVWLSYEGSHADNFNGLYAAIPITGGPALDAYAGLGRQARRQVRPGVCAERPVRGRRQPAGRRRQGLRQCSPHPHPRRPGPARRRLTAPPKDHAVRGVQEAPAPVRGNQHDRHPQSRHQRHRAWVRRARRAGLRRRGNIADGDRNARHHARPLPGEVHGADPAGRRAGRRPAAAAAAARRRRRQRLPRQLPARPSRPPGPPASSRPASSSRRPATARSTSTTSTARRSGRPSSSPS